MTLKRWTYIIGFTMVGILVLSAITPHHCPYTGGGANPRAHAAAPARYQHDQL